MVARGLRLDSSNRRSLEHGSYGKGAGRSTVRWYPAGWAASLFPVAFSWWSWYNPSGEKRDGRCVGEHATHPHQVGAAPAAGEPCPTAPAPGAARIWRSRRHGKRIVQVILTFAILFLSKFVILEAIDIIFGDHVELGGFIPLVGLIISMLVAERIVHLFYQRLGHTGPGQ